MGFRKRYQSHTNQGTVDSSERPVKNKKVLHKEHKQLPDKDERQKRLKEEQNAICEKMRLVSFT
jgi:hypothetical protein